MNYRKIYDLFDAKGLMEEKPWDQKQNWLESWRTEEASQLWGVSDYRDSNGKRLFNVPNPLNFSNLGLVDVFILTFTIPSVRVKLSFQQDRDLIKTCSSTFI